MSQNGRKKFKVMKMRNLPASSPSPHSFSRNEAEDVSRLLLKWYRLNQRPLPWRNLPETMELNQRAYLIWVSEVMLQQTQVATVVDYYKKWIKKWPTMKDLADVHSLEEVNKMWSGLGYYSRARRLFEGVKKVVNDFDGQVPRSSKELEQLPGIGRYTACAIASIAFNQDVGVVDGNVIRVLTRLRSIGAIVSNTVVMSYIWSLADAIVNKDHPGDFNQAMMELGATVCTPKNPSCISCPLQSVCKAYQKVNSKQLKVPNCFQNKALHSKLLDIESCIEDCYLCFSKEQQWNASLGVVNYPRIEKKSIPRRQRSAVCVIHRVNNDSCSEFYMVQRPPNGLLANLWEFPSLLLDPQVKDQHSTKLMSRMLSTEYQIAEKVVKKKEVVGEVVHIFSHIHQTYIVEKLACPTATIVSTPTYCQAGKWFSQEDFGSAAISTAMKKVLKAFDRKTTLRSKRVKFKV